MADIEYTEIGYLKTEQDITDEAQDEALDGKASVLMNMRGYFDVATQTLYTTTDGSDPQP